MPNIELPDGSVVEPTCVDFDHVSEPWGEYELKDGTTLKVRTIVQRINRVDAEDNPQGNEPIYNVQSNTVVRAVNVPDELVADNPETVDRGVE